MPENWLKVAFLKAFMRKKALFINKWHFLLTKSPLFLAHIGF